MAKKVSADEKLLKIVNFLKKYPEIYSIKELEKKIPKECGISSMIVGDLIKNLLDENMINQEKCGASNVIWLFEGQQYHYYSCESEKMVLAAESYKRENERKKEHVEYLMKTKVDSPERQLLMEEYVRLKPRVEAIEATRRQVAECSIEEYEQVEKEIAVLRESTNKLTDDIYQMQSYVCNKFGLDKKDFNMNFNIKEDMDCI